MKIFGQATKSGGRIINKISILNFFKTKIAMRNFLLHGGHREPRRATELERII